jgi:NitT/TauT family transport system substrate-binding protein
MNRWSSAPALGVTTLAVLASTMGCGVSNTGADTSENGKTAVSFRLDWLVGGAHACYYRADSGGHFADQGLDVEILEGSGSGTTATLVANGSDQFGSADTGVVAKTINTGADIPLIAGIYQRTPSVIIALKSSGIDEPGDLVGKTVGAATGEAPLQLLPAFLGANDVDPAGVQVVNMDPASKIPALLQERVDAIVGYSTDDLPVAETQAPGELAVQYYAENGVTTLGNGIVVNGSFADQNPEVVEGFMKAVQAGFADCEEDPEGVVEELVARFPQTVDAEQALIALNEVLKTLHTDRTKGKPVGWVSPEDFSETLDTLEEYAGLTDVKPADAYFTNEFTE